MEAKFSGELGPTASPLKKVLLKGRLEILGLYFRGQFSFSARPLPRLRPIPDRACLFLLVSFFYSLTGSQDMEKSNPRGTAVQ